MLAAAKYRLSRMLLYRRFYPFSSKLYVHILPVNYNYVHVILKVKSFLRVFILNPVGDGLFNEKIYKIISACVLIIFISQSKFIMNRRKLMQNAPRESL